MRVYCKDCRYLTRTHKEACGLVFREEDKYIFSCDYPANVTIELKENWYQGYQKRLYGNTPDIINKDNNCKWYEGREYTGSMRQR